MGRFESYNKIGALNLVGPIGVEVGVTWHAQAAPDLSEISERVPQSITLKLTGSPQMHGMKTDGVGNAHNTFDLKQIRTIRDLLTKALDSTVIEPTQPEVIAPKADNVVDLDGHRYGDQATNLRCPKCSGEWWATAGVVIDTDGKVVGHALPLTCLSCNKGDR